jgi:hypothetical protein
MIFLAASTTTHSMWSPFADIHSLTPRHYNPCRVLADSRSRLQPSLSLALLFQFLTPTLSASLITPSIHLRFGLPTRLLPSGLSKVIFLHGRSSCICTICSAQLSLVILTLQIFWQHNFYKLLTSSIHANTPHNCEVSGFHCGVLEAFTLLRYCVA